MPPRHSKDIASIPRGFKIRNSFKMQFLIASFLRDLRIDFSFFSTNLVFPIFIWTLYCPFSIWTFVSLLYLDFYFFFRLLFLFWTLISLFSQIAIWSRISSKFFFFFNFHASKNELEWAYKDKSWHSRSGTTGSPKRYTIRYILRAHCAKVQKYIRAK